MNTACDERFHVSRWHLTHPLARLLNLTISRSLTPTPLGDKYKVGGVMSRMLEKKREYYLGSGDLLMFRLWSGLVNCIMQGLAHSDGHAQPQPTSVHEFLALLPYCTKTV